MRLSELWQEMKLWLKKRSCFYQWSITSVSQSVLFALKGSKYFDSVGAMEKYRLATSMEWGPMTCDFGSY
jgi:hypothetical protein